MDRILTTHVGSLARPKDLLDMMKFEALRDGARIASRQLWKKKTAKKRA